MWPKEIDMDSILRQANQLRGNNYINDNIDKPPMLHRANCQTNQMTPSFVANKTKGLLEIPHKTRTTMSLGKKGPDEDDLLKADIYSLSNDNLAFFLLFFFLV
eukprot:TRINITY_DN28273_c1_g1_i1.p1 TRINITY_DN28273_c1_g1~~TRINITY_DN28273_c1_g1_i1.p1  ORF type:complete len:103 (-),score=9.04 TRINITY_DN28273_c1_g1_i1:507-815(-)